MVKDQFYKIQPNPWFIILLISVIFSVLLFLANLQYGKNLDESESIFVSTFFALFIWIISQYFFSVHKYGFKLIFIINCIFFFKIGFNLVHFYYFFCPAANILSAKQISIAQFTGDSSKIFYASEVFANSAKLKGLWFAISGDYYLPINNSGVGVFYGVLYLAFGPYITAAIPWASLVMGVSCLLLCSIGYHLKFKNSVLITCVILLYLMPVFFVAPPNYRDQNMVFLIISIVYVSIYAASYNSIFSLLTLFLLGPLIGTLRSVYVLLPFVSVFSAFYSYKKLTNINYNIKHILLLFIFCSVVIVLCLQFSYKIDEYSSRIQGGDHNWGPFEKLRQMGGVFYYLGIVPYALLAPFPWWQSVKPALFTYQLFTYPQTWLGLTLILAVFFSNQSKIISTQFFTFKACALFLFILALAGSENLGFSYIQIIMVLLVLPASKVFEKKLALYFTSAGVFILFMHILYMFFSF